MNSGLGQRAGMSPEQSEIAGDREQREASGLVCGPSRCVAGVATGLDDGDVHAAAEHVLGGVFREPRGDPAPLVVGIDTDDVDRPMRSWNAFSATEANPTGFPSATATKTSRFSLEQARPDRLGLTSAPVRVQAKKVATQTCRIE